MLSVLAHGQFYGAVSRTVEVGGFVVAERDADPRLHVPRHTHESAHFIFVMSGPYITTARGAPRPCRQPTLIYNPPGTTHQDTFAQVNGRAQGRFTSVGISEACMAGIVGHTRLSPQPIAITSPHALTLAARLVRECRAREPASPLAIEGLCLELTGEVDSSAASSPGHDAPAWLRVAREYLRGERAGAISVRDVAIVCGVHPVHLARVFRRFVGCSPGDFARRARVERAAALLSSSSLPLSEVALEAGFADQSHMTKAFRRAGSMTPAACRRLFGRGVF